MQKTPASDQELNLKKRARRRLVGAVALVLIMVVVLPMILKDRSGTQSQDKITITLPGEQQVVTPVAPSDFDSNIVPTEPPVSISQETEVADETVADSEAAPSKPEAPVEKPVAEVSHKFYVQIGVFSDAANVKQLQSKLSDLGYKSQTEKINTDKGQKIRLKTQQFGDRNEAAIALENIKDAGLTGMVVSQ
jgi:DedD protein